MGSNLVSYFVGAVAVLAFLGTGATFVLRGKQEARITNLEDSNADLRNDVGDRDRRIVFLEAENESKTSKIEALEAQLVTLERLKLGEAYFQAIEGQIAARAEHVDGEMSKMLAQLDTLRGQARDMLALLADQRRPS